MTSLFKKALAVVLCLFVSGFVFATGTSETPAVSNPVSSDYPQSFVDDLGNQITLQAKPQQVLSLSLFSDEVLLELLDTHRFAAISAFAQDPIYSNVAEQAAAIEPVIDFTVETVVSLYPDLVIAANWSDADKVAQVRAAGIPVYLIDTPFTIEAMTEKILTLGQLVGEEAAAQLLVDDIQGRIDQLVAIVGQVAPEDRATAVDYNTWGTANGSDTTWNLVLELAGVENAAAQLEPGDYGQVPMSKEVVVELDPDFIFVPGYIWGEPDAADAFLASVLADPAFSGLRAIEARQVISFPENLKGSYSQYLITAAETLARMVYPDYFQN